MIWFILAIMLWLMGRQKLIAARLIKGRKFGRFLL